MSTTKLKHQIIFYFICGAISTSFDIALYFTLLKFGIHIDIAKGSSFLFATLISYFLNKYITFKTEHKSFMELFNFVIVHVISMLVDVGVNRLMLTLLGNYMEPTHLKTIFAVLVATSLSVSVNFAGQKFWVFRK